MPQHNKALLRLKPKLGSDWPSFKRIFESLSKTCLDYFSVSSKELLDSIIHSGDPKTALFLLEDLCLSLQTHELKATAGEFQAISLICSFSPTLARHWVRHPHEIKDCLSLQDESLESFSKRLRLYSLDYDNFANSLRQFKNREFIRILLADLYKVDSFSISCHKLSLVADICLEKTLDHLDLGKSPLAVIAFGKMGGRELNYHSDIDIIFALPDGSSRELLEHCEEKSKEVIELINSYTAEGIVFKVDSKIRPEGNSGQLVRTLTQYRDYYHNRALSWERQALIKARACAGDKHTGQGFNQLARAVAYGSDQQSKHLLQDVAKIKDQIEVDLLRKKSLEGNVKLGVGGIRDIEFVIQFLQLHHGRIHSSLQLNGSLEALEKLHSLNILHYKEYIRLRENYIFLRIAEHILQLKDMQPVRHLPEDKNDLGIFVEKLRRLLPEVRFDRRQFMAFYQKLLGQNRSIFLSIISDTNTYLNKYEAVSQMISQSGENFSLNEHFERLENDYFSFFRPSDIFQHIQLASKLNKDNSAEIIIVEDELKLDIHICAFDYIGQFSQLCGIVSSAGLNIISGASYTYRNKERNQDFGLNFYRRPKKVISLGNKNKDAYKRKIFCYFSTVFLNQKDREQFSQSRLMLYIKEQMALLEKGKFSEAREKINLKVIQNLKDQQSGENKSDHAPLQFYTDNISDPVHTILEVEAEDHERFLYEFTTVLSQLDYYLGKINIRTSGKVVKNTFYLTTRQGNKIKDKLKLEELKLALVFLKQFSHVVKEAANPSQAINQFSQLLDLMRESYQQNKLSDFLTLDNMKSLARVFGTNTTLWTDFIRAQHETFLPYLFQKDSFDLNSIDELQAELNEALNSTSLSDSQKIQTISNFKDRQLFRADLAHMSGQLPSFSQFSFFLAELAEVVYKALLEVVLHQICSEKQCEEPGQCYLLALGKWGSRELGYASDLELILIYKKEGSKEEARVFYNEVAKRLKNHLRIRRDGIFETDFRLRPDGESSDLATELDYFKAYYDPREPKAHNFERQAMVRYRFIFGEKKTVQELEYLLDLFIYENELSLDLDNIAHMRKRQIDELAKKPSFHLKYGHGGLSDAEFAIQVLQIAFGKSIKELRNIRGFLNVCAALFTNNVLSEVEYEDYCISYRWHRAMINSLRIVRGHAKDLHLPEPKSLEFQYFARRMKQFMSLDGIDDLYEKIVEQTQHTRVLFEKALLSAQYIDPSDID